MSNENPVYEHALFAVLYAVKANGRNLNEFYKLISEKIISNSIRPRPQDQEQVLALVQQAINDIEVSGATERNTSP
jgi:hypothetical protein